MTERDASPSSSETAPKLPERPGFVSPMPPAVKKSDTPVPLYVTVITGIAAFTTLVFSVLLFLKR
jgi:hypothetical protein